LAFSKSFCALIVVVVICCQVGILQKLTEVDKNGNYCVLMYKNFTFGEHFCIVTELLGPRYSIHLLY
jgi:hypothetical protein